MTDRSRAISRRNFLGSGVSLGLAGAALPGLLAACGSSGSGGQSAVGHATLPASVPPQMPTPQVPGDAAGVRNGYWQYPAQLRQSVHETPGRGGTVTSLLITYSAPPTPLSHNTYWQQFNKNLGVDFQPTAVAEADFRSKLPTVMASNDLPDVMNMYPYGGVSHLIQFLEKKCQDLTPYLSGGAAKAYPNLAALGDFTWSSQVMNGRLWGLPNPEGVFYVNLFILQNLADQVGISTPRNVDEFERLMKGLNRPNQGRWALGASANSNYNLAFFYNLFGVPNSWAVDKKGHFTKDLETEGAREAIAYIRKLFVDGVFHPDANNMSTVQSKNAFASGQIAAYQDGFGAYPGLWKQIQQTRPDNTMRVVVPFGHNGGKGQYSFRNGTFGVTVFKKASKARIEELLRVANYIAAPFGTVESSFMTNGVKDVDHTLDAHGNPTITAQGTAEMQLPLFFFTNANPVDVSPQFPDYIKATHEDEQRLVPIGLHDPTVGLYSETVQDKGANLSTMINDQVSAIISGRAPMSSFSSLVRSWRSEGGEQMRTEYQKAYEAAQKKK